LDELINGAVEDALEEAGEEAALGLVVVGDGLVDEGSAFEAVGDEAFVFHGAEEGLNRVLCDGGFGPRMHIRGFGSHFLSHFLIDLADGGFVPPPEDLEDFEFALGGGGHGCTLDQLHLVD
jgi:hypothetical protein